MRIFIIFMHLLFVGGKGSNPFAHFVVPQSLKFFISLGIFLHTGILCSVLLHLYICIYEVNTRSYKVV